MCLNELNALVNTIMLSMQENLREAPNNDARFVTLILGIQS